MQQLSTANVLARMAPTERPCVHQALFETETLSHKELQERITNLVAAGRDGYYEALTRTLGSHDTGRVLDGNDAPSLLASVEQYRSPNGLLFIAATDIGINYSKLRNEDRVVLRPDCGFAAVVDGMGGQKDGDRFAHVLAHELGKYPNDPNTAIANMRSLTSSMDSGASACMGSVSVARNADGYFLRNAYRVGDVRVAIIVPTDEGLYVRETTDKTKANERVQAITNEIRLRALATTDDVALEQLREEFIYQLTAAERERNVVTNALYGYASPIDPIWENIPLPPGSFVLLLSDGITDNLDVLEILFLTPKPLTSQGLLETIQQYTTNRMTNFEQIREQSRNRKPSEKYSDGFLQNPKPDNRGLAIIEVPR